MAASRTLPPADLSRAERSALSAACERFEAQIRWRWKLARVDRVQDASGRPTGARGGFSGVSRVVQVGRRPFILKGWPAMSRLDRALGNLAERLGAFGDRYVDLDVAARVRHDRARREELLTLGVLVPRAFDVGVPRVLVMEYFGAYTPLQALRERDDLPLGSKLDLLTAVTDALADMHEAGTYHSEPGAGNVLLQLRADGAVERVAFTDFEWCFRPSVPLATRQAADVRYFALQQAAQLARRARQRAQGDAAARRAQGDDAARRVLEAVYATYGARRGLEDAQALSRTGPRMFMEALGYMGVSIAEHRRLQALHDAVLGARGARWGAQSPSRWSR